MNVSLVGRYFPEEDRRDAQSRLAKYLTAGN